MHGWDEVLLFLCYRLETQAQIWEMFHTRWHKNLVAEPQIPSPCTYFSVFYLQDLPSYQRSMKPKAVQRGRICSHRHTRIFKQKLEILRGWAVSGMGPCLSLQPPKTGALLGSMLQSWYTACSSTAKILLPAHSVATDSLYRQSLHHCGCFSPLSSFLCPAGEKHCADCPVLTHMLEWWNLSSPCPPAHLHQDILGPVGGLGEEGGKSIVCLSAKNAEESLPSRGGQGALSNRLCSDAAFGTHRPAPLMQVQGWLSSCQTDLVLCC